MSSGSRIAWVAGALATFAGALPASAEEALAPGTIALDIERQPIGDALNELARQSGLQIVLYTEVGEGVSAPSLVGELHSP